MTTITTDLAGYAEFWGQWMRALVWVFGIGVSLLVVVLAAIFVVLLRILMAMNH